MPNMDWKKETSGEFIVYPAGTYRVRIISWERLKAATGTEQIRWRAEIVEPEEYRGKSILDHTALTETALWRLAKAVACCGIDTTKAPSMDTDGPAFESILNACKERTVFWNITEDMYNGKVRNKVVDYVEDQEQPKIEVEEPTDIAWDEKEK